MTIDKEKLKALAEASEEWSEEIGEREWYAEGTFKKPFFSPCDAKFISSTSPATILALLAEIERLERDTKNDAIAYKAAIERQEEIRQERDRLKAENEAMRNSLGYCAASLEGEMLQKFGGQKPEDMHPVTRREYDRDMAELAGYRAAMAKETIHG